MDAHYPPYIPEQNIIIAFKAGSEDHIKQMQSGLLYMNSLSYFSSVEENGKDHVRRDPLEKIYSRTSAGDTNGSRLLMSIGKDEINNAIDMGDDAVLNVEYGEPGNIMIFCMSAFYFTDKNKGTVSGEVNQMLPIDRRFKKFGTHVLFIRNISEFSTRISKSISDNPYIYWSENLHEMYGLVEYKNLKRYSGHVGLYRKSKEYKWQREFRLCFGVHDEGLNKEGAFELQIGDISDISEIMPLKALLSNPLSFKRTRVKEGG